MNTTRRRLHLLITLAAVCASSSLRAAAAAVAPVSLAPALGMIQSVPAFRASVLSQISLVSSLSARAVPTLSPLAAAAPLPSDPWHAEAARFVGALAAQPQAVALHQDELRAALGVQAAESLRKAAKDLEVSASKDSALQAQLNNLRSGLDLADAGAVQELGTRLNALFENTKSRREGAPGGDVAAADAAQKAMPAPWKLTPSQKVKTARADANDEVIQNLVDLGLGGQSVKLRNEYHDNLSRMSEHNADAAAILSALNDRARKLPVPAPGARPSPERELYMSIVVLMAEYAKDKDTHGMNLSPSERPNVAVRTAINASLQASNDAERLRFAGLFARAVDIRKEVWRSGNWRAWQKILSTNAAYARALKESGSRGALPRLEFSDRVPEPRRPLLQNILSETKNAARVLPLVESALGDYNRKYGQKATLADLDLYAHYYHEGDTDHTYQVVIEKGTQRIGVFVARIDKATNRLTLGPNDD